MLVLITLKIKLGITRNVRFNNDVMTAIVLMMVKTALGFLRSEGDGNDLKTQRIILKLNLVLLHMPLIIMQDSKPHQLYHELVPMGQG